MGYYRLLLLCYNMSDMEVTMRSLRGRIQVLLLAIVALVLLWCTNGQGQVATRSTDMRATTQKGIGKPSTPARTNSTPSGNASVMRIVFSRSDGIYTVAPDSKRVQQLINEPRGWESDPFAISLDGRWAVLMNRCTEDFNNNIYLY